MTILINVGGFYKFTDFIFYYVIYFLMCVHWLLCQLLSHFEMFYTWKGTGSGYEGDPMSIKKCANVDNLIMYVKRFTLHLN